MNSNLVFPDVIIKKVLKKLKALGILVDNAGSVLFILFALYEKKISSLDAFDDENKEKRAILLYKDLELKGLIEQSSAQTHFELTSIGMDLVEWIRKEYGALTKDVHVETFEEVTSIESVDDWIQSFINLWPAKSPEGWFFRQDKEAVKRKMQKFRNIYDYTKEEIFAGANAYLADRYKVGFTYTKKVSNFIWYRDKNNHENETSDLAAWCEFVRAEKTSGKQIVRPTQEYDAFLLD